MDGSPTKGHTIAGRLAAGSCDSRARLLATASSLTGPASTTFTATLLYRYVGMPTYDWTPLTRNAGGPIRAMWRGVYKKSVAMRTRRTSGSQQRGEGDRSPCAGVRGWSIVAAVGSHARGGMRPLSPNSDDLQQPPCTLLRHRPHQLTPWQAASPPVLATLSRAC